MTTNKNNNGDLGLMIVSVGIILVGIIGLFFDTIIGGITLAVGLGVLLMGYVSKRPLKNFRLTKVRCK